MRHVLLALVISGPALAQDTPTPEQLLAATDDVYRGTTAQATLLMEVRTARYERTMRMTSVSQGTENTLIRIVEPVREAGVATLKVGENIWNYLPKVDRTIKVPAGMMGGRWMGSHFTNDDLVQESRFSEDFTWTVTGEGEGDDRVWTLDLIPKPDTPVVWGRIAIRVGEDRIPRDARYFDEDGTLARTMTWGDVAELGGRTMPTTMTLVPGDEPEEYTRITYVDVAFDVDLPDNTFTQQALRR